MIRGADPCFQYSPQGFHQLNEEIEDHLLPSPTHSHALLNNLSILRDKIQLVQSLFTVLFPHDHNRHQSSIAASIAGAHTMIQDIIATASSLLYALQQGSATAGYIQQQMKSPDEITDHNRPDNFTGQGYSEHSRIQTIPSATRDVEDVCQHTKVHNGGIDHGRPANFSLAGHSEHFQIRDPPASNNIQLEAADLLDQPTFTIVELEAADLLAHYTHYCHICSKGFKREANLRMHMRAHGDEYKSSAALSNPVKRDTAACNSPSWKYYSCPHEGCRWNRRHAKFQPLKSIVCVKNHYRRSHCPKMYVCKLCNCKQFSVLADLRTHEKHCGNLCRWRCSCGTTFSRKDKLMGHVTLFVGHAPVMDGAG